MNRLAETQEIKQQGKNARQTNDRLRLLEQSKNITMYTGLPEGPAINVNDLARDDQGILYKRNQDNTGWEALGGAAVYQ